jgi:hypothetical protein
MQCQFNFTVLFYSPILAVFAPKFKSHHCGNQTCKRSLRGSIFGTMPGWTRFQRIYHFRRPCNISIFYSSPFRRRNSRLKIYKNPTHDNCHWKLFMPWTQWNSMFVRLSFIIRGGNEKYQFHNAAERSFCNACFISAICISTSKV